MRRDQINLTPEVGTHPAIYIKWLLSNQYTDYLLVCLFHSHHIVEKVLILKGLSKERPTIQRSCHISRVHKIHSRV